VGLCLLVLDLMWIGGQGAMKTLFFSKKGRVGCREGRTSYSRVNAAKIGTFGAV
jgi:hypothetical protein